MTEKKPWEKENILKKRISQGIEFISKSLEWSREASIAVKKTNYSLLINFKYDKWRKKTLKIQEKD